MNNDWFRHDSNAHDDIKQKRLLRSVGLSGLGLYWYLVELIYQNGGKMSDENIRLEAELVDGLELLNSLQEVNLLTLEDGFWSCKRITDELQFKEESKQKKSEAGKKGMASRWNNAHTTDNTDITPDNSVITEDNSVITKDNKPYQTITSDNTLPNHTIPNNNSLSKESLFVENDVSTSQKKDTDSSVSLKEEKVKVPYESVKSYWNEKAKGTVLPQITKIDGQRKKHLESRWSEYGEDVFKAIDKVFESDYLSGRSGKWLNCTFDWILLPSNMVKILEGNYRKKEQPIKHRDYSDVKSEDFKKESLKLFFGED